MPSEYHVVMPFSRPQNWEAIYNNLKPLRITLHLILNDVEPWNPPAEDWIRPCRCYVPPKVDPCYWKLNYFNQSQHHIPEDYYLLQLCDDDALPPDFFHRINDANRPNVAYVVSADNGQFVPAVGLRHPARRYEACPEKMFLGGAGSCRPIVKGKWLYAVIYPNSSGADQITLCALVQRFKDREDIIYVNKTAIMFNYLEPGRWKKEITHNEKSNATAGPIVLPDSRSRPI
jgi:hypothetical protein